MRKILSIILTFVVVLSMCASAFANDFLKEPNLTAEQLAKGEKAGIAPEVFARYYREWDGKTIERKFVRTTHEPGDDGGKVYEATTQFLYEDMYEAVDNADMLYLAGMFKGTGKNADGTPDYSLDKCPTREEALVMLIRLLGEEERALSFNLACKFTDVSNWAKPYVAYAYEEGITKGISDTQFGKGNITAQQYATFMMRALALTEGIDYSYDTALKDFSKMRGTYFTSEPAKFLRADMVNMSMNALMLTNKEKNLPLVECIGKGYVVKMQIERGDATISPSLIARNNFAEIDDLYMIHTYGREVVRQFGRYLNVAEKYKLQISPKKVGEGNLKYYKVADYNCHWGAGHGFGNYNYTDDYVFTLGDANGNAKYVGVLPYIEHFAEYEQNYKYAERTSFNVMFLNIK